MPWWTWLSLSLGCGGALLAGALALVTGIRVLRGLGRLGKAVEPGLAGLEAASARLEAGSERLAVSQAELAAAAARTQGSVEQVRLLSRALEEPLRVLRVARMLSGLR